MAHLFLPLTDSHFRKISDLLLPVFTIWWQKLSVIKSESINVQSSKILSSEVSYLKKDVNLIDSFELKQSLFMILTGLSEVEYKENESWFLGVFNGVFDDLSSSINNLIQENDLENTYIKVPNNENTQPIKVNFCIENLSFSYILSRAFVGKLLFHEKNQASLHPRLKVVAGKTLDMSIISSALSLKYEDFLSLNEGDVIMFNDGRIGECDLVSKEHNIFVSKVDVGTNNSDIVIKLK